MNSTIGYLKENFSLLVYSANLIEGIGCTLAQTEEIIQRGEASGLKPNDIIKIVNYKHALEMLFEESRFPVELGTCFEYNSIVGANDITHANPGYLRIDKDAIITGCSYTAPPITNEEAISIVNYYHNYNDVLEQALYLLVELSKKQMFYNGNKRTATLVCNHLLCYNDYGGIFAIKSEEEHREYIGILLQYYENIITRDIAIDRMRCFIY